MGFWTDPIKAWKAMLAIEKELQHHHSPCRTIRMRKLDGSKVLTDEENAEVFCAHFDKNFNNQHPLPCDITALDLITPHPTYSHLTIPPMVDEVQAALRRMANRKALGTSGATSNALKSMT
eukprot:14023440-Ditylum_brightwellii.AAC.2